MNYKLTVSQNEMHCKHVAYGCVTEAVFLTNSVDSKSYFILKMY